MAVQFQQVNNEQTQTFQEVKSIQEDAAPTPMFPAMDFTRFEWRVSPSDPRLHAREVVGCELYEELWTRFNHGEFIVFSGVDINASNLGISNEVLIQKAHSAWQRLRFAVPTVASRLAYGDDGKILLTYKVANSTTDVHEWASRTFQVKEEGANLNQVRYTVGQTMIPTSDGDLACLHFIPRKDGFGLLLQSAHVLFDGAGTKVLITKYLKMLIESLACKTDEDLGWGTEAQYLEPAIPFVLAENQIKDGPVYDETLGEILTTLALNQPKAHGLRDTKIEKGNSRRVQHKFNKAESAALLKSAKSKGFTINQISHAALSMVAAEDSPMTESSAPESSLLYFNLVNSRNRLVAPYKEAGYASNCLAMHPVAIPMAAFSTATEFEDESVLHNIATIIKEQYERAKASPALIGVIAQQIELMLSPLVAAAAQAHESGQSIPIPTTFGPWYSGDGIVESFLPRRFENKSGETVFEVEDVFTSLNIVDPRPFFRMYTFRDEIVLSVDHNENAIASERIDSLLSRWAELFRLVLQ